MKRLCFAVALHVICAANASAVEPAAIEFSTRPDRLLVTSAGQPVATYVWSDEKIPRPYYCDVYAPGGARLTRNHPPVEGEDLTDHELLHPGIWLAFGDLDGADFWRNKARIEQAEFIEPPHVEGNTFSFVARYVYRASTGGQEPPPPSSSSSSRVVCEEVARRSIEKTADGYLFRWDSTFRSEHPFYFGDQEEMGLGIRLHTPLSVAQHGEIVNSAGLKNEKQIWGKPSDWCLYSGPADGDRVGVLLMPDPRNFRQSWLHARDYGMVACNPFGRNAFTGGAKSRVEVAAGEEFRLRYALLIYQRSANQPLDAAAVYSRTAK